MADGAYDSPLPGIMKNPPPNKPDSFQDIVTIGHDAKCIPLTSSVIAAGDAAANLVTPILKDDPYTTLFKEGGTMNGKHFDSFADIFRSLGVTFVGDDFKQGGGYVNPKDDRHYQNTLSRNQKKLRKSNNKRERQLKKRGRR